MLSEIAFGVVFLGVPRTAEKNPSVLNTQPHVCSAGHGMGRELGASAVPVLDI